MCMLLSHSEYLHHAADHQARRTTFPFRISPTIMPLGQRGADWSGRAPTDPVFQRPKVVHTGCSQIWVDSGFFGRGAWGENLVCGSLVYRYDPRVTVASAAVGRSPGPLN
ncbi:hypothetical protein GCM10011581_33910 [Saccharopolyspora subtropica]|uniref:Uncharacterized protein n=1 Tax=Saccharopolyspora thermophila TaxID=89367 RepID=A0A917K113_9PSEU|nr:hypothetical protein GCM10011581_33910 [Saccharopolyspora subtropica]